MCSNSYCLRASQLWVIRKVGNDEALLITDVATRYVESLDYQMRQSLIFFDQIVDSVEWGSLNPEQKSLFANMHQSVQNALKNLHG